VSVSADQFNGTEADFPLVQRVLIGMAHDDMCS
jgi:hypothetical protein